MIKKYFLIPNFDFFYYFLCTRFFLRKSHGIGEVKKLKMLKSSFIYSFVSLNTIKLLSISIIILLFLFSEHVFTLNFQKIFKISVFFFLIYKRFTKLIQILI